METGSPKTPHSTEDRAGAHEAAPTTAETTTAPRGNHGPDSSSGSAILEQAIENGEPSPVQGSETIRDPPPPLEPTDKDATEASLPESLQEGCMGQDKVKEDDVKEEEATEGETSQQHERPNSSPGPDATNNTTTRAATSSGQPTSPDEGLHAVPDHRSDDLSDEKQDAEPPANTVVGDPGTPQMETRPPPRAAQSGGEAELAYSADEDEWGVGTWPRVPEAAPTAHKPRRWRVGLPRRKTAFESRDRSRSRTPETGPAARRRRGSKFLKHARPKAPFTVANQIQRVFTGSWTRWLLPVVPAAIALNFISTSRQPDASRQVPPIAIAAANAVSLIPLRHLLDIALEEVGFRTGTVVGGIIGLVTFLPPSLLGSLLAFEGQHEAAVSTVIGAVVSVLLFTLGAAILLGGFRRMEQYFNATVVQAKATTLALAVFTLLIPTGLTVHGSDVHDLRTTTLSTAVIQLVMFAGYLFFELRTHTSVFSDPSGKEPVRTGLIKRAERASFPPFPERDDASAYSASSIKKAPVEETPRSRHTKYQPGGRGSFGAGLVSRKLHRDEDPPKGPDPQLHATVALATVFVSGALIGLCCKGAATSAANAVASGSVPPVFLGFAVFAVALAGSDVELVVGYAIKDKMDIAMRVAFDLTLGLVQFCLPVVVIVSAAVQQQGPITMASYGLNSQLALWLGGSVVAINYISAEGKSAWFGGFLLLGIYVVMCVASWGL